MKIKDDAFFSKKGSDEYLQSSGDGKRSQQQDLV